MFKGADIVVNLFKLYLHIMQLEGLGGSGGRIVIMTESDITNL